MKITVVGLGYVGLANALLLSQNNEVIGVDILPNKIQLLNEGGSPIADADITNELKQTCAKWTTDLEDSVKDADLVIIATPTDYDDENDRFNTTSIESTIEKILKIKQDLLIVIKSTVPVGYTSLVRKKFNHDEIIFCPEFLQEGKALYDSFYPSRVVVGDKGKTGSDIAKLFTTAAKRENIKVILVGSSEAEAIKLFSNTYLALRVAYFNELDSYCITKNLNTSQIIEGVSSDSRIGNNYNNPSFGYGGYCLPKDTKQLMKNFSKTPHSIISAIVKANSVRKKFITSEIIKREPKTVGVYRLVMKADSDNFRESAVWGIIEDLKSKGLKAIIYEPIIQDKNIHNCTVINDLDQFKKESDLIIANRNSSLLNDVAHKVFTRDIFGRN